MRAIINGIRTDPEPPCGGLFGPIKDVCLFDPTISWDTTRTLYFDERVFVISHIGQGRKFLALYMYILLLTK